jgi:hypothetical protein
MKQSQSKNKLNASTKPVSIKHHSIVKGIIQPKLKIGAPNDKYEQEADRVADQVMRMPTPDQSSPIYSSPISSINNIHRKCAGCASEDDLLQKKSSGITPDVTPSINSNIQSLQGKGQPLSKSERNFFEPRFGTDFSHVRLHTDNHAAKTAQSINAKAFTHGDNVVFGAGEYSSDSVEGKKLLAHELTHVVQQKGATLKPESTIQPNRKNKAQEPLNSFPLNHSHIAEPRIQRRTNEPTAKQAKQVAWHYYKLIKSSKSKKQFKKAVEATAAGFLKVLGADALVFSISGAAGFWGAVGGGYEIVYSPRFGWATYFQLGAGLGTPGGSVALEVGVIWNLANPRDYKGSFIELAGSFGKFSGSVAISPSSSPTGGVKVGGSIGSSGASLLYEYYWQLTGISSLPNISYRGHYTFFLKTIFLCGRKESFVVQFNTEDIKTRRVRMKILYKRTNKLKESTFNLKKGEQLNPILLDEGKHQAIFDVSGDHISDLQLVIPSFIFLPGTSDLNISLLFRGKWLHRIHEPGIPMGKLKTGLRYFRIRGTEVRPSGPLYIDECGSGVNDRNR